MSEPISGNGAATFTATGVTIAGVLSGVDDGVLIGAFAGAVIFVLSATEFALFKKVMLLGYLFWQELLRLVLWLRLSQR